MRLVWIALACAVVVSGCGGGGAPPDPTPRSYTFTDLGSFLPAGINVSGDIAGALLLDASNLGAQNHAAVWRAGVVTDLGTFGGAAAAASAIDDTGLIAGSIFNASFQGQAYSYSAGKASLLPTLGGPISFAVRTGGQGWIAGQSLLADGATYHAALWRGGGVTDLGVLPGDNTSSATWINRSGVVVGYSYFADPNCDGGCGATSHGFVWREGKLKPLTAFGTGNTSPVAVNDSGVVVGATDGGQVFLWQNGMASPINPPGLRLQFPRAINNQNQIAGSSRTSLDAGYESRAVLLSGGRLVDLNNLTTPPAGWLLSDAVDINDAGQIIGTMSQRGDFAYNPRGFLLTPAGRAK